MTSVKGSGRRLAVAGALLFMAQWAVADGSAQGAASTAGIVRPSPFAAARPMTSTVLAAQRGGAETPTAPSLAGAVSNSSATNVTTGANTISDGAFANVNGLPMVVQNSGNNVVIQTSTIVNITVK